MRMLVLGGTVFLGRALTDAALAAGNDVTHFHRGRTAGDDARVTTLHGDRTDASAMRELDAPWDVVFDTSGYLPQVVAKSVAAVPQAKRYVFVSSISAYAGPGFAEDDALHPVPAPLPEAMTPDTYGGLKAGCEAVVRSAFGDHATIVRPGLIVGPHDRSDRFTYWPVRIARGGRVAAPGNPGRAVQFIDVRDLGAWMVALARQDARGIYNATGPGEPLTMGAFLEACRAATGSDAHLEWIDDATLARHEVAPWSEMPLFIPESEPFADAFNAVPIDRARATGLAFRTLRETILDTLEWARTRPADHAWRAGLPADKEAKLLA